MELFPEELAPKIKVIGLMGMVAAPAKGLKLEI
jgi:hypothetical protein